MYKYIYIYTKGPADRILSIEMAGLKKSIESKT